MYKLKLLYKKSKKIHKPVFAIKKETLFNGTVRMYPVVRQSLFTDWTPIVKVYGEYFAMFIETDHAFTEEECREHIEGYKQQLFQEYANKVDKTNFQLVA